MANRYQHTRYQYIIGIDGIMGDGTPDGTVAQRMKEALLRAAPQYPDTLFILATRRSPPETSSRPPNVRHEIVEKENARVGLSSLLERAAANPNTFGVLTAGNTKKVMPMVNNTFAQRRLIDGLDVLPLMATIPTTREDGLTVSMADVGGTTNTSPGQLSIIEVLATTYTAEMNGGTARFGLLTIGTERGKGDNTIQEADKIFREVYAHNNVHKETVNGEEMNGGVRGAITYVGLVEPADVFAGKVDVVVARGNDGNLFIKTAGALGKSMKGKARQFIGSRLLPLRILDYAALAWLSLPGAPIHRIKTWSSSDSYGGAPFLGIDAAVVKIHGASPVPAIEMGISRTHDYLVKLPRIRDAIRKRVFV